MKRLCYNTCYVKASPSAFIVTVLKACCCSDYTFLYESVSYRHLIAKILYCLNIDVVIEAIKNNIQNCMAALIVCRCSAGACRHWLIYGLITHLYSTSSALTSANLLFILLPLFISFTLFGVLLGIVLVRYLLIVYKNNMLSNAWQKPAN